MPAAGDRQNDLRDWVARQHEGQLIRRTEEPYLNHLLRVAEMAAPFSPLAYETGLCHDLLEKTQTTPRSLLQALLQINYAKSEAEQIANAVVELTEVYTKAAYPNLRKKVRKEKESDRLATVRPLAQTVKYADVFDNILWMLKFEPAKTLKYLQRKERLFNRMDDGDPVLREKVLTFIKQVKKLKI